MLLKNHWYCLYTISALQIMSWRFGSTGLEKEQLEFLMLEFMVPLYQLFLWFQVSTTTPRQDECNFIIIKFWRVSPSLFVVSNITCILLLLLKKECPLGKKTSWNSSSTLSGFYLVCFSLFFFFLNIFHMHFLIFLVR